jgi:hypothetical protein
MPKYARSGNPGGPLFDLIAFLGVLALGAILVALGHVTAGSLAAVCAALAGLYTAWKRSRTSERGSDPATQPDAKPEHGLPAQDAELTEPSEPTDPLGY